MKTLRRVPWALVVVLVAFISIALAREHGGLSARYHLMLNRPAGPEATCDVHLVLEGGPRESLVVFATADRSAIPLSDLRVTDDRGRPLRWLRRDRTMAGSDDRKVTHPRIVAVGPLPGRVHVRYRTVIGIRQGDDHTGFNGKCFGLALPNAVVFSGRSVFLVPEAKTPIRRARVTFSLPDGWEVQAPWDRRGNEWVAGVRNAHALDHLISATVGLGEFSVRRFRHLGTEWRLAIPSATAGSDADTSLAVVERATRYVSSVFRRGLGPRYLVLVLPKSTRGDEVPREGWATGQGGTLIPATRVRTRDFAERLVDAYALHAPYRSTLKSQRDFWVPSALRRYYGTTCLAAIGLLSAEELAPSLAIRLATAPGSETGPLRLERDYTRPGLDVPGGEPAGAALLYDIDRTIRRATANRRSLDDVVANSFRGRVAQSPWKILPRVADFDWARYRQRHLVEGRFAPLETFPGLTRLAPAPEPSPGTATRRVRLVLTGTSGAFLENCGCKTNQSGGVARRETMLRRLRADGVPTAYLDAGNAFPAPGSFRPDDKFSREEARLALGIMKSQDVIASAVSTHELTWGLDLYRSLEGTGLPYVSFVTDSAGNPLAPPHRIVPFAGLRWGIVSAFVPPVYVDAQGSYENHSRQFRTPDPLVAVPSAVRRLERDADLVCVIGRIPPPFVRKLLTLCPEIDLVVSTEPFALVSGRDREGKPYFHETDQPGFFGRSLVVYTTQAQYGLTVADLDLTAEGRIAHARLSSRQLTDDVPDDPRVRGRLAAFYREIGRSIGGAAAVERPFHGDTLRWSGRYAGAEACRDCHEGEYAQWKRTPHASAYKTLLDAHRNYQPRCVTCHVVAYGAPHGYQFGDPSPRLVNVQCEVCHGPAAAHAEDPESTRPLAGDDRAACLECHNPEHSDGFVFEDRLPAVVHDQKKAASLERLAGTEATRRASGGP